METERTKQRERSAETQSERFTRTARELGCDEDPEAFKHVVRNLAKARPAPRTRLKKDALDNPE